MPANNLRSVVTDDRVVVYVLRVCEGVGVSHNAPLTSQNAMEILGQYDIIVNGCDNFATRYLVNDAAYLLKKPLVDGSIFRFEGQSTVFMPGKGCYRCLFPAPPPPGAVPSCAEAGVLGALPGMIGIIQATETVKLILGIGEPLIGRLLHYDALNMAFKTYKIRRDPKWAVGAPHPRAPRSCAAGHRALTAGRQAIRAPADWTNWA